MTATWCPWDEQTIGPEAPEHWCPAMQDHRVEYVTEVARTPTNPGVRDLAEGDEMTTWQEAYEGRLVGMTTVKEHAGEWTEIARLFVKAWLEENPTLFPDDLWTAGLPDPPNHKRALGPVLAYAKQQRWMERSTDWRQSTSSHLAYKVVWTSLLYDAAFVGDGI